MLTLRDYTASQDRVTEKVHRTISFIDKITIVLPREIKETDIQEIEHGCGYRKDKKTRVYQHGTSYDICQPTSLALKFINKHYPRNKLKYLEIALDFIPHDSSNDEDARFIHDFLEKFLVKKWRGKQRNFIYDDKKTTYYGSEDAPQNIAIYSDRRSKVRKVHYTCHLEWRIRDYRALERLETTTAADLINFDHREFWKRKLTLRCLKDGTELSNSIIQHILNMEPKLTMQSLLDYEVINPKSKELIRLDNAPLVPRHNRRIFLDHLHRPTSRKKSSLARADARV